MKKNILVGLSIFLLFFISLTIIFIVRANRPLAQAKREAIAIAEKQTSLKEVDNFYWYNREETFYTVAGRDKDNQQLLVVIPKNGGKIKVIEQSEGLTEYEAIQAVSDKEKHYKMTRVNFGILDNEPIWEILAENENGSLNYYSVSFDSGRIMRTVENV